MSPAFKKFNWRKKTNEKNNLFISFAIIDIEYSPD